MRNLKTALFILALVSAHAASANTYADQASIIKTVNNVNIIADGVVLLHKALIEPVRLASLKFVNTGPGNKTESTIRGIVIRVDMATGTGTLREERSNRLVTFTFAKVLLENHVAVPKVGAYVEFIYTAADEDTVAMK